MLYVCERMTVPAMGKNPVPHMQYNFSNIPNWFKKLHDTQTQHILNIYCWIFQFDMCLRV